MLCRASAEEKLGLTLCYETDNVDGFTDIFIDDIHPDGLAKRDGRLRLGDQIIQVFTKGSLRMNLDVLRIVDFCFVTRILNLFMNFFPFRLMEKM